MAEQNMCRMTQLRLRYGISQADLANAAGVSRQLISLIELDTARLAHELDAAPWLFSMSKEDDEHGF